MGGLREAKVGILDFQILYKNIQMFLEVKKK